MKKVRDEKSAENPNVLNSNLIVGNNFMSSVHWDALARVLSVLLTTVTIIALARGLGPLGFADFQINLTIVGYILWVGDFGLLTKMINLSGNGNAGDLFEAWNLRITCTILALIIYLVVSKYFWNSSSTLIAIALVVDGFVDANYNLRMLTSKNSWNFALQPIRKAAQTSMIILALLMNIKLSANVIFIAFIVPSLSLLIWDIKNMGGVHFNFRLQYLKKTFIYFFQGGSTYVANLDYLILANSGNSALVTLVALPRRIVNSISLLGSLTNPRIQNSVARYKQISRSHIMTISLITLVGTIFSITFAAFAHKLFLVLFGFHLSDRNVLLVICVLLSAPIQMLVVSINALYFGLEVPKYPVIASYLGSGTYIILLAITVSFSGSVVLSLGFLVIARLVVELVYLLLKFPGLVGRNG
jgi:O-antigen/teichoic acid export membrane protein